ncbi:SixA phosphatase family protein [Tropicibacter oceani]|uniref:Histidine phosphatase family protein n=1 Tax=Tropicibacter oceani TaxID=3058420 RepID=A0ABY8QL60_9RHOB|nr:histidine phosphatase family protein [Tropicibacter oceani]WGW05260.1 histidine phosphatase family protein [Tropicibacter oceani]
MKRLILMRHAKSDWSFNLEDHARPLNTRGVKSAKALGDWLRRTGTLPDEVLCSDAARTRETLKLLGIDAPIRFDADLYLAEPERMLDRLRDATGDTVLLIAHNPGICALAHDLLAAEPDHDRFDTYPTGATLVAQFDIDSWETLEPGTGRALDFVIPHDLIET